MPSRKEIRAAGVVIFRPGRQVVLVHRPKYDDWSFPKGKLDPGEHSAAAAIREVAEETDLHVRLGPQLTTQRYPVAAGTKVVDYWTGTALGEDGVDSYTPNREIDEVAWLDVEKAAEMLTYQHDRETLAEARGIKRKSVPLVILRHAAARSRKAWKGEDTERPLISRGHEQAQRIVPLLAAYDVQRVVSSDSLRCVQTVQPYAETTGYELESTSVLSEERSTPKKVGRLVDSVVDWVSEHGRGAVLCSHRPVLPEIFAALDIEDPKLEVGEMLVLHLRKGRIIASERH